MKELSFCLILIASIVTACATIDCTPLLISNPYGGWAPYGEKIHPGIDYKIPWGTPVIAVSDEEVVWVQKSEGRLPFQGGYYVVILHGDHFKSIYVHLSKVFVVEGQLIERGQLVGNSGRDNTHYAHLHFGITEIGGSSMIFSQTYNPEKFWLDDNPKFFDPKKDYSTYSQKEITLPIACGEYAKALIAEAKEK